MALSPNRSLEIRFIEVPAAIHHAYDNSDKFPLFQMIAKNVGILRAKGDFILATNIDILFSDELIAYISKRPLRSDCFYRIDRHDVGKTALPTNIPLSEQLSFCAKNIIRIHTAMGSLEGKSEELIARFNASQTSTHTQGGHAGAGLEVFTSGKLHTNACGDFTLMARSHWHKLRAYPEIPKWSIFIDGILLHMALASGLKQVDPPPTHEDFSH